MWILLYIYFSSSFSLHQFGKYSEPTNCNFFSVWVFCCSFKRTDFFLINFFLNADAVLKIKRVFRHLWYYIIFTLHFQNILRFQTTLVLLFSYVANIVTFKNVVETLFVLWPWMMHFHISKWQWDINRHRHRYYPKFNSCLSQEQKKFKCL